MIRKNMNSLVGSLVGWFARLLVYLFVSWLLLTPLGGGGITYAGQLLFDGVPVDITTADNEDLVITPGTGGNTQIGDASGTNSNATSNDDLHITGKLEVDGAAYFDSGVTLGDSSSDTITATGRFGSHLVPSTDSTYDLGSSSLAWRYLYADIISGYNANLALNPASGYSLTGLVTKNADTGNEVAYDLDATINKSTSGNYTAIELNVTETSAPGAADLLLDLQVAGASMFNVDNAGNITAAGTITGAGAALSGTTSNTFEIDTDDSSATPTLTFGANVAAVPHILTQVGDLHIEPAGEDVRIEANNGLAVVNTTTATDTITIQHDDADGVISTSVGDIVLTPATGNVGIDETAPGARLEVNPDDADDTIGIIVDQDDTGGTVALQVENAGTGNGIFVNQDGNGISLNVDSEATSADVVSLDGSVLTTGNLIQGTVTDTLNTDAALINVTGTALNTATNVTLYELSTTAANDVDVTAVKLERGANDARIVYDEGVDTWQLDQGGGTGLVSIATTAGSAIEGTTNNTFEIDTDDSSTTPTLTFGANVAAVPHILTQVGNLHIEPAGATVINDGTIGTAAAYATAAGELYVENDFETRGKSYYFDDILLKNQKSFAVLDNTNPGTADYNHSIYIDQTNNVLQFKEWTTFRWTNTSADPDLDIMELTPTTGLNVLVDDALNNNVTDVFTLRHTTTGAPAATIGVGQTFHVEDAGGVEEQGSIDVLLTTVTDGAEDADMVFQINQAGTISEIMRLDGSADTLTVSGGGLLTLGASNQLTIDGASTDSTTTTGVINLDVDSLTNNDVGFDIDYETTGATVGATNYAQKVSLTQSATVARTLYGYYLTATDASALASTLTGIYIDVTTANAGDTVSAATLLGGKVEVGAGTSNANATGAGELYVQNDLEVDGTIYGNVSGSSAITGTTASDFTIDSDGNSSTTNISLTFGGTNPETIAFTGATNDDFEFSDAIRAEGMTLTGALAANAGITFDNATDTVGAFTSAGTINMNTNIIENIGNTGTDFVAATGALNLAGTLTLAADANLTMSSGGGVYSQTFTGTTTTPMTITANSLTTGYGVSVTSTSTGADAYRLINLSSSGAAAALKDRYGIYSSMTGTGTGVNYAGYFSASGATTNYPGYFTGGPVMITDGTHSNTNATASGELFVDGDLEVDGVFYPSGGIGAFTSGGDINMNTNIITNIGNANTDFVAATGALNLAGALTLAANANLTMSSGTGVYSQTYTGAVTDAFGITADSVTTADAIEISADALSTGNAINISSTSTAGNSYKLINLASSGANAVAGMGRYGVYSSMTGTGATSTNYAGYFSASGATTNYSIYATGNPTADVGNIYSENTGNDGVAGAFVATASGVGSGAKALYARNDGRDDVAAHIETNNANATAQTLYITNNSTQSPDVVAIVPTAAMAGGNALAITNTSATNDARGMYLRNDGDGAVGAHMEINNTANASQVIYAVTSGTGYDASFVRNNTSTNTTDTAIELKHTVSTAATGGADGIGAALIFNNETSTDGTEHATARIAGVLTDADTVTTTDGDLVFSYAQNNVFKEGMRILADGTVSFEGSTDDGFETIFSFPNPAADRTITFPDADVNLGTINTNSHSQNTDTGTTSDTFEINTDGFGATLSTTGLTVDRIFTFPDDAGVLVGDDATQTLSGKTLTAPKFADLGFIADANGNELLILDTVATAVNEVTLANAATGTNPTLTASGETNVSIGIMPKGTGGIGINDSTPDGKLDFDLTSTSTAAATEYGANFTVSDTGVVTVGTDTTYGQYTSTTRTGATGGTINTYGIYSTLTADAAGAGTSTAYGVYSTVTGADTNYPGYFTGGPVMITDGTHTNTNATASGELFVDGDLEVDGTIYGNVSGSSAITGTTSTTFEIDNDAAAGLILDATGLATSDKTFTFPNVTSKVLTNNMSDAAVAVTLYSAAADGLNFDSNTLSIDAANNRVGIGTASPATNAILEVAGGALFGDSSGSTTANSVNVRRSNTADADWLTLVRTGAVTHSIRTGGGASDPDMIFTNDASGDYIFYGQNFGIGSGPSYRLDVAHPNSVSQFRVQGGWDNLVTSNSRIVFNDDNFGIGAGHYGAGANDDALVLWSYNGASRGILFASTSNATITTFQSMTQNMFIDGNTGSVGIGDTTPDARLDVDNTSATVDSFGITHSASADGINAVEIAITQQDDADATDTNTGITITPTSSSLDADTFIGINIGNITAGAATENAIRIGTGWDRGINFLDEVATKIDFGSNAAKAKWMGIDSAWYHAFTNDTGFRFYISADQTGWGTQKLQIDTDSVDFAVDAIVGSAATNRWLKMYGNILFEESDDYIGTYSAGTITLGNVQNTSTATTINLGRTSSTADIVVFNVGYKVPVVAKTAAYTATTSDMVITGDATTVAFSITLPAAAGNTGRSYTIKKIDASANAVTVDPNAAETVDGAATYALSTQWKYVTVVSNGTNWIVTANN